MNLEEAIETLRTFKKIYSGFYCVGAIFIIANLFEKNYEYIKLLMNDENFYKKELPKLKQKKLKYEVEKAVSILKKHRPIWSGTAYAGATVMLKSIFPYEKMTIEKLME